MENETPTPDEKKPRVDPQSGKVEPAPIDAEGARVLANEAREELEDTTPLDDGDVRQLAEDYVTERGADDTDDFERYAEERARRARSSSP
jgi:hypothetical protein